MSTFFKGFLLSYSLIVFELNLVVFQIHGIEGKGFMERSNTPAYPFEERNDTVSPCYTNVRTPLGLHPPDDHKGSPFLPFWSPEKKNSCFLSFVYSSFIYLGISLIPQCLTKTKQVEIFRAY